MINVYRCHKAAINIKKMNYLRCFKKVVDKVKPKKIFQMDFSNHFSDL